MIDIGRRTKWGNPFFANGVAGSTLERYEMYARTKLALQADWLAPLAGQVLFCPGCGIGKSTCHGRVLEKLLEESSSTHSQSVEL